MDMARLTTIARHQHGCITYAQALDAGASRGQWRTMLADGVIVPMRRGVVRLVGAPPTPWQIITAAALAAGPDAIASHTTGAQVWDAPIDGTSPVHLVLPIRTRTRRLPGIVAHHPRDLVDLRPVVRRGIAVTNPLRVLCDVGAVAPGSVTKVLEHFLISGYARPDVVRAALDRHARPGRNGIGPLRAALDAYPLGHKPPDSVLEPAMVRLVRRFALPAVTFHPLVLGWEVDFQVDETPVIVECDGWSSHGLDRDQFERDRRKDAELRAHGFVVCRYSWHQITRQPRWVAENLRAVLARCAPDVLAACLLTHPEVWSRLWSLDDHNRIQSRRSAAGDEAPETATERESVVADEVQGRASGRDGARRSLPAGRASRGATAPRRGGRARCRASPRPRAGRRHAA